jgi:hypothetical protein
VAPRRFIDQHQPQTLQSAVLLCYVNAALSLLLALALGGILYLPVILLALAAYGIANERKWGYWGGVVLSVLDTGLILFALVRSPQLGGLLSLAFAGVLVVLLLHQQSRSYERIYFRWNG